MFYYLRGKLTVLQNNLAVLDCGGVGYKLTIPASTCSALSSKLKQEALLYTHLAVREDAMELYGFASEEELELFRKLISVSGIGPKGAAAILSTLTTEEFIRACAGGDYKSISRAPGIGAKTAQRVILELKDKVADGLTMASDSPIAPAGGNVSQVVDTLVLYGFTKEQIKDAMRGMNTSLPLEDMIAETLRILASKR